MFWVLAILIMDSCAAEPDKTLNVTSATDVLLPCPCDNRSVAVLWQVDRIIVNYAGDLSDAKNPDESYKKRTNLFWQPANQNCSLLLHNVSTSDPKIFKCMIYVEKAKNQKDLFFYDVKLNVEEIVTTTLERGALKGGTVADPTSNPKASHMGVSVGVPLSVILVILAGLVVALLIRKRRQNTTTMVVIQDPNQADPMLKHCPV